MLLFLKLILFFFLSAAQVRGEKITMGALGDSVTTATNALGWGNQPRYSWSTGTSDLYGLSHFLRLEKIYGKGNVKAYNKAVMGQETLDLENQINELLPYKPDYVTLLMGGNDICHMDLEETKSLLHPTALQIEKNMESALQRLVASNPKIKILMVPVPDLIQVWTYGHDLGCQWMWDLFSVCTAILSSDRTEVDRMLISHVLKQTNDRLIGLASKYSRNVRINPDITKITYNEELLSSRDCFHPSAVGQGLIAEKAWEKGWYEAP